MNRILISLCVLLPFLVTAAARGAGKPNILFLVSDDQRFDTIHALGNVRIRTPNLDALVNEGTTLTRAYCMGSTQSAVCVCSRAMFLSGRSLFRAPASLPADVPILPEILRKAGYTTFGTGKWHNGPASFARAFDAGDTIFFGGMGDQFKVNVQPFDPEGKYPKANMRVGTRHATTLFTDSAVTFLKHYKGEKPFFAYVAYTSPHDPRTAPEEFAKKYDPAKMLLPKNYLPVHPFNNGELTGRDEQLAAWPRTEAEVKKHLADYYAMVEHLDFEIGRLLQTLEEIKQRENTLIVFFSDHGLAIGSHGLMGKQNLYEESQRAPLLFNGPGLPKGRRVEALCYLFDILPTLCTSADVQIPAGVEGKNLLPALKGEATEVRREIFGAFRDFQRSLRTTEWKLIRYPIINRSQLFEVKNDPEEITDLAARPEQAERVKALTQRLAELQKEFGDTLPLSTDRPAPLQVEGVHYPGKVKPAK